MTLTRFHFGAFLLLLSIGFAASLGWAQLDESADVKGLQNGDLVFLSMPCQACDLIEATTHSPYSHVGIIEVTHTVGMPQTNVVMAAEPQVMRVSLNFLLAHGRSKPVFMRMKSVQGRALARRALVQALMYLGTPYDSEYWPGDDRLYCSELIYFSFLKAREGQKPPFMMAPMKFGVWSAQWEKVLGHKPPEGVLGISPGDISRSELLESIEVKIK